MRTTDVTFKLLSIGQALRRWQGAMAEVDERRRDRIARYAEEIAATLARTADAFERLEREPGDKAAARAATRELARISGYIEGIAATLEGRIDGRRVIGLRRRLEGLALEGQIPATIACADATCVERLTAAEGYFHAIADGLRT